MCRRIGKGKERRREVKQLKDTKLQRGQGAMKKSIKMGIKVEDNEVEIVEGR